MNLLKKLFYYSCSVISIKTFSKFNFPGTLFPYHHIVSDEDVLHIKHLYRYKNISQFNKDLEYLLKYFKPVTVEDIISSIKTKNLLPANSFLLTFDDGFREIYDTVAPILEARGLPAIFFINPAFIDNRELFYRGKISLLINELLKNKNNKTIIEEFGRALNLSDPSLDKIIKTFRLNTEVDKSRLDDLAEKLSFSFNEYLQNNLPCLTTEQLISLHNRGFTIGAHSWDHPYYKQIAFEEQVDQTISSCNYVKQNFSPKQLTFSFPYSDAGLSQKLFNELNRTNIDLLFGIQNQKEELCNKMVHRFNAERPEVPLSRLIKGMLLYNFIQKKLHKNKVRRY